MLGLARSVLKNILVSESGLVLQVFTSFCAAPDRGTQVAATGALAMLARHPEVALRIASGARRRLTSNKHQMFRR